MRAFALPVIVLRTGLGLVFAYAAVGALIQAEVWVDYLPDLLRQLLGIHRYAFLSVFAMFELVLAAWLFWGGYLRWSAGLPFVVLIGITAANLDLLDVVFRDLGLATAALALFVLSREDKQA